MQETTIAYLKVRNFLWRPHGCILPSHGGRKVKERGMWWLFFGDEVYVEVWICYRWALEKVPFL